MRLPVKKYKLTSILIFFFFLINLSTSFTQDLLKEEDWNKIIPYLVNEDWVKAEKITKEYLNKFPAKVADTSDEAAILRYMYIRCVGANLSQDKDKGEAMKKVKSMIGKPVVTPEIVFKEKGMFNYFTLTEDSTHFHLCAADSSATQIHTFERYEMKDPSIFKNIPLLEGQALRLKGIIKTMTAEGFAMPRLEIFIEKCELF